MSDQGSPATPRTRLDDLWDELWAASRLTGGNHRRIWEIRADIEAEARAAGAADHVAVAEASLDLVEMGYRKGREDAAAPGLRAALIRLHRLYWDGGHRPGDHFDECEFCAVIKGRGFALPEYAAAPAAAAADAAPALDVELLPWGLPPLPWDAAQVAAPDIDAEAGDYIEDDPTAWAAFVEVLRRYHDHLNALRGREDTSSGAYEIVAGAMLGYLANMHRVFVRLEPSWMSAVPATADTPEAAE